MASAGPNSPGSATNITDSGIAWTNASNVFTSDDTRATVSVTNKTDTLYAYNFSMGVPSTATITGIKVEVERSKTAGSNSVHDYFVWLTHDDYITVSAPQNLADTSTNWPGADAYKTYGGEGNLCGRTWTPSQINHSSFGIKIAVDDGPSGTTPTAAIDHIRITVYYDSAVLTDPKILKPDEIILFGTRFKTLPNEDGSLGTLHVSQANQPVPKIITNRDYSRDSSPIHSTVGGDDLTGGMGHWQYFYGPDGNRLNDTTFWTGQNIDTTWPRAITLGPLPTEATPSSGIIFSGGSILADTAALLFNTSIYTWDGSSFSGTIDTLPATAFEKPTRFNGRLFYPTGGVASTAYSYQTSAGSAATDVTTSQGPSTVAFGLWDDRLYALDTTGTLWTSTTGDANSWGTALARVPGGETTTAYQGRVLLTFPNASGDVVLHAITAWGMFAYDAENDKWIPSNFTYEFSYPTNVQKVMAAKLRESLFISPDLREVWKLDPGIIATDISFYPVPSEFRLEVVDYAWDTRNLFALLSTNTAESVKNDLIVLWNGRGWHPIRYRADGSGTAQRRIALLSTSTFKQLMYGIRTTLSLSTTEWIDLRLFNQHPQFSTTKTYGTTAQVELPIDDAGFPEQIKTAQEFRIKVIDATNDETVQVAYRLDGSNGSYTNLGDAVSTEDETHIPFGASNEGLEWKSIQLKFTLARGATTTNSPKIAYWALDFIRNPKVIRGYTLTLDLRKPYNGLSPQEQIDRLWGYAEATLFGTFAWLDENKTAHSSLVKIVNLQGAEESGAYPAGTYTLSLIEVGGTSA